jgi:creatinine amidohydrolase
MKENTPRIRWEEMLPDELLEAIRRHPVCYLAFGLAEPHGVYNALGLDWLKAYALVERAARTHGGVVAPPFAWHVQERDSFNWPGYMGVRQPLSSSIPEDLFLRTALFQIRAVDARGFKAGILVTGHYGGLESDLRLLCEYYVRRTRSPLRLHACADWELIHFEDYKGDHAGVCETSQLMALRPELVDVSRKETESTSGPWAGTVFPDKRGRSPSRELGEKIVESQVRCLGEIQKELLAAFPECGERRAPGMAEAEDIWHRFDRISRKYWWMSTTLEEWKAGTKVPFPGWESLGE